MPLTPQQKASLLESLKRDGVNTDRFTASAAPPKLPATPGQVAGAAVGPENAWMLRPEMTKFTLKEKTDRHNELMKQRNYALKSYESNLNTAEQIGGMFGKGKREPPTGTTGPLQTWLGKTGPLAPLRGSFGIPTEEQTGKGERLERLGAVVTFENMANMKGALSNKDLEFLRSLSYGTRASRLSNAQMAQAQAWMGARQKAYAEAQDEWRAKLGSPAAVNAQGKDFGDWWDDYAAQAIPNPLVNQRSPKEQANVALKRQSARSTGQATSLGMERR